MSYEYRSRTRGQLKRIADQILARFASRRHGFAIDIEAILEDLGLEIIFRPSLGLPVEAYIAKDPRYVVMRADALAYPPRGRFTIAEEVCHRILEYQLWEKDNIPDGARVHELSDRQLEAIERDARSLAAEILQPEQTYRDRFELRSTELQRDFGLAGDRLIRRTVRAVASDLDVSMQSAAYRARVLELISPTAYKRIFPPLL